MGIEDDTYHVVIRLPFKRPEGFIEPPSIIWTDEMEHQLWQYMSQKNRDWNSIAEQLGVPTTYVVRHAAFIYETQLRGIHQQLRINTNNISLNSRNTKSPTASLKTRTSIRYSSKSSQSYLSQQPQQQLQQQSVDSNSSLLQHSNTVSSSCLQTIDNKSAKSSLSNHSSVCKSSTMMSNPANSNNSNTTVKTRDYANYPLTATVNAEESQSQQFKHKNDTVSTKKSTHDSIKKYRSIEDGFSDAEDNGSSIDEVKPQHKDLQQQEKSIEGEEEFSNHFERMKLQIEEPAFLPQHTLSSSSSSHNLRNSRQQLSMSIQSLRRNSNNINLSLANPTNTSSVSTSRSPSSTSQTSFKTTDNNSSVTLNAVYDNTPANAALTSSTPSPYTLQQLSQPDLQPVSSHSSTMINNAATAVAATISTAPGSTSNESALNSIGSSFSDLSDSSITQSALEEAFLSKFNQGTSRMSLLNFSHRYKDLN
ncbi:hypothetical protein BDF20DRAFT_910206 [Mycotypha africana]|uniref:uncharacterized protein n=1 Tax=Mycotypha africana TaxID=64632 RepID=UPI002301ED6D|nr:uncharacterized protein BDF20DRAFT_910206 [Mycotypha africana]KAI8987623.1 hypothetical protein BDF20DRAFT_910206 [Mycotypha africana]